MAFTHFSKNGVIRPLEEAFVPLSNIEYTYGFGVYETIRVVGGVPYFLADHAERLMISAALIDLAHTLSSGSIAQYVHELIDETESPAYNLKLLLVGGATKEDAMLSIVPLNPLFLEKKLYRDGVSVITYPYERAIPHAKSLNMLQSYLAYREARGRGAYDALFVDRDGFVTEGSRTNMLRLKGDTIFTSDPKYMLLGVTQKYVLKVAEELGLRVQELPAKPEDLQSYDCVFLTGSSINMLRIASVDGTPLGAASAQFDALSRAFDAYVSDPLHHQGT